MEAIFFLPGITGTRLNLDAEEIWPPTLLEGVFGYHRIAKLLDPRAAAGKIIDEVTFLVPIYKPLLEELDKIVAALNARKVEFPYDWRLDLWTSKAPFIATSEQLAKAIEAEVSNGATSITLVCHSMGCLVARLVLESDRYKNTSWYKRIRKFVAICGPHLGAPLALERALGLSGDSGISAPDMKVITGDSRYPAGYQLFPVPGHDVLYDVSTGHLKALDIYNVAVDKKYGLTRSNVQAAQSAWREMDIDTRPKGVEYELICGKGFDTVNALTYNHLRHLETLVTEGDGIVPLWSSLAGSTVQHYIIVGSHVGIMQTANFKRLLHNIMGVPLMASALATEQPEVTININKRSFAPEEMMDVVVIADSPASAIEGSLRLDTVSNVVGVGTGAQPQLAPYGTGWPVQYRGPPIWHISTRLPAPRQAGVYTLGFEGSHRAPPAKSATFFVTKPAVVGPTTAVEQAERKAGQRKPTTRRKKPTARERS